MPNWCQQYGEVRGDNAELKRFVDAIRVEQTAEWLALKEFQRPYWDMNQLFPIPKELSDTISGGYGVDENGDPKQVVVSPAVAAAVERLLVWRSARTSTNLPWPS